MYCRIKTICEAKGYGYTILTSRLKSLKDINSLAIDYMEDKYGEQFIYVEAYGDSMDGTRSFFVVSESFPDEKILVEIEDYTQKIEYS